MSVSKPTVVSIKKRESFAEEMFIPSALSLMRFSSLARRYAEDQRFQLRSRSRFMSLGVWVRIGVAGARRLNPKRK